MSNRLLAATALGGVRAALRHGRWFGLAVAVVVVLGAVAQFAVAAGAVREVATAQLRMVVVPPAVADTSTILAARQDAEQIALLLVVSGVLADPALDAAIAAASGLPGVTAHQVGQALAATASGSLVTLAARWPTAAGAQALAGAASKVLGDGGLAMLPTVKQLLPAGALLQVQAVQPAGAAAPDGGAEAAARQALAVRLALAAIAGLLAALGWGYAAPRWQGLLALAGSWPRGRSG